MNEQSLRMRVRDERGRLPELAVGRARNDQQLVGPDGLGIGRDFAPGRPA